METSGDKMKTNGEAGKTGWRGFPSLVLPAPEGEEGLAGTSSPNNASELVEGAVAGEEEGVDSFLDNFSGSENTAEPTRGHYLGFLATWALTLC